MNSDERICSIALTLCPGIGHIGAKRLIEGMGSAAEVFSRRKELPEIMPGVNPGVVTALDCPAAFLRAEQEMEFVEKNRLSCLTLKDEATLPACANVRMRRLYFSLKETPISTACMSSIW